MRGPEGFRITATFDEAWYAVLVSSIHDNCGQTQYRSTILVVGYNIHDSFEQSSTYFEKSYSIVSPVRSSGVRAARRHEMRAEM